MRQLYLQLYLLLSHAYSREGVHAMRQLYLLLSRAYRRVHSMQQLCVLVCRRCTPCDRFTYWYHMLVYLLVSHACRRDGVHTMRAQHVCAARRLAQVLAVRRKYL
jgi:hypothetical protein